MNDRGRTECGRVWSTGNLVAICSQASPLSRLEPHTQSVFDLLSFGKLNIKSTTQQIGKIREGQNMSQPSIHRRKGKRGPKMSFRMTSLHSRAWPYKSVSARRPP